MCLRKEGTYKIASQAELKSALIKLSQSLQKNFVAAVDVKSKRKIARDTPLKHRDVIEIMTSK